MCTCCLHNEASDLAEEDSDTSRHTFSFSCASQTQQPGVCNGMVLSPCMQELAHRCLASPVTSPTSLTPHHVMPWRLQTIQYSVIGVLLVIAGLHTLFFRGARYAPLGCQPEVQHGAKLDTSLLVGIQQLRYEQRMLQADRDKLLGTAFSQVQGGTTVCRCKAQLGLEVHAITQPTWNELYQKA
jgi:hypothetical protein